MFHEQRRVLETKRAELVFALQAGKERIKVERQPDALDEAVQLEARDLACKFLVRERVLLLKVEDALSRIKAGKYGECLDCGDPVAPARLSAVPWAESCLGCQERQEARERAEKGPQKVNGSRFAVESDYKNRFKTGRISHKTNERGTFQRHPQQELSGTGEV